MKWKGHSETSWEAHANVDRKCQPWLDYKRKKKAEAHQVSAVANIAADILSIPSQELIVTVCKEAGIKEEDVMFVYAGVPCETFSIAGRTNKDRDLHITAHGYNYRRNDDERNPCCDPEVACPYGDKTRLHDSIVKHVINTFHASYEKGLRFDFVND